MNMKTRLLTLAVVLVTLLIAALPAAFAVTAAPPNMSTTLASLDWSGLTYSSNLDPYSSASWSQAYSTEGWGIPENPPYDSDYKTGITDTTAFMQSGEFPDFSSATGTTRSASVTAEAVAASSTPEVAFSAVARPSRTIGFKLEGPTAQEITISIPYSLTMNLNADNGTAHGYVRAWSILSRWDWVYNEDTESFEWIQTSLKKEMQSYDQSIINDNYILDPVTGVLTIAYLASPGDYYQFDTGADARSIAYTAAAVPAPSALLLLCSGVVGLLAIRKRH